MLPSLLFSLLLGTLIQDVYESLIQKAGKPRNINNIFSFSKELCLLYFSIPPSLMVKLMLTIYIPPCCQCEKYRFLRRTIKMESLFPTRRKIPPTGSYLAWVNRSQRGAESSWACGASASPAAGPRASRGPVSRLDSSGFSRETACGERAEISLKAAVAVLRASPTPLEGRALCAPSSGQHEDEKWTEPEKQDRGSWAPRISRAGVREHLFQVGGSDAMGSFPSWMTASWRAEGPEL